ncbi:tandem-95 repeat protein [Luteolibacter ambystomatis]|uniref:Tandem-95 repeat protein n=1 Tax=Luteolibacter ambystomatis TaxID=2824561 RepID=A0A975IXR1_9BACT|nr:tandem-95 repeat protein [Luteolibacter ambystomatis]QUE49349.1 tandem-95 repeat protein [Luteolibacter ambystomatis]
MNTLHTTAAIPAAIVLQLLPFVAQATPTYNWDLQTHYPGAEPLPSSLTSQQLASINQLDDCYPQGMITPNGTGLTPAEMNEVTAMPAYFSLSRNPTTGVLSGRDIVMDGDQSAVAQPDVTKPASFYADFTLKVERLTDLYVKANTGQAPQLEQTYSDLIEHFLDLNYLPGGRAPGYLPVGNGYLWRDHGWKTLRMIDKLSADKRDLYALSLAHVCGFSTLLPDDSWSSTDVYVNYYPTANKALALMSDTPAKWQLIRRLRRGMDVSTIGRENDPVSPLVPLDGSIIHHNGYASNYASYSYAGQLVMHTNWTTAGFTSAYTAQAIVNMRRASLAWCFTTTGGLNPLHQIREGNFPSGTSLGDGGAGNGPDFALKAANLTSAYYGTPIADDLEMAYAAISKTGVGSTALPTQWRTITPPADPDPTSPLYTATLQGHYSRTTNGTSIQRGPGDWVVSLRGQPTHWTGAESRSDMGLPPHFIKKMLHGSLELITTGKNGRKPNEVDSGYRYEGWNPSYYPNVTCPDYAPGDLLDWKVWAYFSGESNLTGSANLRDCGVWMNEGTASKSAFFLGNRIVLVTNNVTGNGLHTGLIQTAHDTPASEPLLLDGASKSTDGTWTLAAGGNHKIVDPRGNAYYVHADAATPQIQARRGNQDWTYSLASQWTGTGTAPTFTYASDFLARMNEFTPTTANYSRVWFDHGASATNQALTYTVLVKPQPGGLDNYATAMASPATAPVTVTKSTRMHRYQDRATGTNAIAVFDPNEAVQMGGIATVNRAGAYIWRTDGDLLRLSINSSQTENTAAFQLALTGEWTLESQQGTYSVTVTPNAGGTTVSLSYRDTPQNLVLRRVMPQVVVTAPANNTTVNAPTSQTVAANVTSHGHTIAKVQFFDGTTSIGEDATAPYAVTWTTSTLGSHSLSAHAVISATSSVDSAAVVVSAVNTAPVFTSDPIQARAVVNTSVVGKLVATDSGYSEILAYAKVSGPAWLTVAADGTLGGTPSSGNLGTNTFTVRVTDSYGAQANATLSITVGQTNAAPTFTTSPIAKPSATEDAGYSGTLAGSATDADAGDWITYTKVSGPTWLQVAANGALSGTPSNSDVGANTFTVKATDGAGAYAQATLNLNVTNVNDAPVWANPALTKADATAVAAYSASVATDASDADVGDTLTFTKVAGPAWLNVAADGALSGTPTSSNDSGQSFTLRVTDSAGASADATLTIAVNVNTGDGTWVNAAGGTWNTVTNWNAATIADGANRIADFSTLNLTSNAVVTLDSTHAVGQLKFGDTTPSHNWSLNGSTLKFLTTTGNPTIQVNNGTATVGTVLAGFQGFTKTGAGALTLSGANTYTGVTTASDGSGLVTVNGNQNAATGGWLIGPGSSAATTVTYAAGSQLTVNAGKQIRIGNIGATGTSSQTLNTAGAVVNAGSLLVGRPGVLNVDTGGTWDQSGTMSIAAQGGYGATMNVKNRSVFSYYGSSTVKVNGAPGSGGPANLTIDGLFATTAGFEQTTTTTGYGRVTLQNGGTIKLAANIPALSTRVQFMLGTGGGVIDTNGFATSLDLPLTGVSGFTKSGAGMLSLTAANTYTGATNVSGGSLVVNGSLSIGAVTVQSGATLGGSGAIGGAVTVQSGGTLAPAGDLTVNNAVSLAGNTVMTLGRTGATLSNTRLKGVTTLTCGGTLTVTDVGTDVLVMGDTFQLFSAGAYTSSFSGFTLPPLPNGLSWHTGKLSTEGILTVGSPPLPVDDSVTTAEDVVSTFAVMANDGDPDGDTLSLSSVTQGAHGSVTISGSNVHYTPAANYNGSDNFTYTVTDSTDGTATATVAVTVTPVNDAPTFTANPITGAGATEDAAFSGSVAGYASDIDAGDTLTFSKASGPAWLNVAANGTLGGTPANDDVGMNHFVIRVTDAAGATADSSLAITVANTNDAPAFPSNPVIGANATEDVAYGSSLAGTASDVDAGDTLSYSKVGGPTWLAIAANGTLSGTPVAGDVGSNSFTVRATDSQGATADATLTITVGTLYYNGTWTNANGGSWPTVANWSGEVMANGPGRTADFSTLNLTANATVTFDGARKIGTLIFGDTTPSHDWTLNPGSGGTLTLSTLSGTPTIQVNNRSANIGIVLAGTQGLTKAGTGSLTLSGANTYSGTTTANAGTCSLNGDQSAANGGWTINAGATVNVLGGATLATAGGKSISLANNSTAAHALNVAGTVTNNGSLSVAALSTVTLNSGGAWTQSGSMAIQSLASYANAQLTVNSGASFTYTSGTDIKLAASSGTGAGNGTLTVNGGIFTTGRGFSNAASGTGTGSANLILTNGGTLKLSADIPTLIITSGRPFTFQCGTGGGGLNTNGFSGTLALPISGTGGFTKSGSGTLTLSGASTHTGATTLEGGTLAVTGSLGATAVDAKANATLALKGNLGGSLIVRSSGHLAFDVAASPGAQVTRTIAGILTLDSGNIIDLSAASTPAAGTYVLATASSISGTPGTVNLPAGVSGTVSIVGNNLQLTIGSGFMASNAPAGNDATAARSTLALALGTDPATANSSASGTGITTRQSGGNFIVTFSRDDASENSGRQLLVDAGDSPGVWTQVFVIGATTATSSPGVEVIENGGTPDTIIVTIPLNGCPSHFARLRMAGTSGE